LIGAKISDLEWPWTS